MQKDIHDVLSIFWSGWCIKAHLNLFALLTIGYPVTNEKGNIPDRNIKALF